MENSSDKEFTKYPPIFAIPKVGQQTKSAICVHLLPLPLLIHDRLQVLFQLSILLDTRRREQQIEVATTPHLPLSAPTFSTKTAER